MLERTTLKIIRFYQSVISPFLGRNCRFWPSCSCYARRSVEKYGLLKGSVKSFKRILKCGPWNLGGVDLP